MDKIIAEVEQDESYRTAPDAAHPRRGDVSDVICGRRTGGHDPARGCDRHLHDLGRDRAAGLARAPGRPILGLTPDPDCARLALAGAPTPCMHRIRADLDEIVGKGPSRSLSRGVRQARRHDRDHARHAVRLAGGTNLLRVARVPEGPARA